MPKVKITNLKDGACVINSLKLTIAGKGAAVRDASVIGDPDLSELEAEGIVSVVAVPDVAKAPPPPPLAVKQEVKNGEKSTKKNGKKNGKKPAQPQQPQQPRPQEKPSTSFRVPDGPEDEMGRKVVVMGEDGPVVKHMGPGINGTGPKFVGDEFDDFHTTPDDGFQTV